MPTHSGNKTLNAMNRLADMGHFPAAVNAGATGNVLLTLIVTFLLQPSLLRHVAALGTTSSDRLSAPATPSPLVSAFAAPLLWTAFILALNLTPVVLLRRTLTSATAYPPIRSMNFWTDQHKFSDWVYLAASANMAFWILTGWTLFAWHHAPAMLLGILAIAALATFSPVLRRAMATG